MMAEFMVMVISLIILGCSLAHVVSVIWQNEADRRALRRAAERISRENRRA